MNAPSAAVRTSESFPASAEFISRARSMLVAFAAEAGAEPEQQERVRLVVSEAVTNAVQHAYGGERGEVHVTAAVVSDELWILIADDGRGLRPGVSSPGLGLGLVWMAQFSDGMTLVTRSTGGVEVRLRFDLPHEEREGMHPDPLQSRARIAGVC